MKTKDWLLLLIPIICNGFLIFYLQTFISHKFKIIEKHTEIKLNIIKDLSVMLCDEHEKVIFLLNTYSTGYNSKTPNTPVPFATLWNPISNKIVQIYNYTQLHKVILHKEDISINELVQSYEQLVSFLSQKADVSLTDNDRDKILQLFNDFKESIINLNITLEQIMIKK